MGATSNFTRRKMLGPSKNVKTSLRDYAKKKVCVWGEDDGGGGDHLTNTHLSFHTEPPDSDNLVCLKCLQKAK